MLFFPTLNETSFGYVRSYVIIYTTKARTADRGVGRGFPWVQETPFNFQYVTQSSTSDITNDINDKNFEAQYSFSYTLYIVTYLL